MRKKLLQLFIPVFLLVFIRYVVFFMFGILPLLFNLLTLKTEYNISDKNLKLSKSYSIIGSHFKNYTVLVYIRIKSREVKENKFQKDDII